MRRRTLLAAAGASVTVPLTGYAIATRTEEANSNSGDELSSNSESGPTLSEQFECRNADRPEPDVQAGVEHEASDGTIYESVGSAAYPSPPERFDSDSVITFVEEYEQVYEQNRAANHWGDELINFEISILKSEILDHDSLSLVHINRVISSYRSFHGAGPVVIDSQPWSNVYAIDKTAIVRIPGINQDDIEEMSQEDSETILQEGDLLSCF